MKPLNSISVLDFSLLLLITFINIVVKARNTDLAAALQERRTSAPGRELKASSRNDALGKRYSEFVLTKEIEINYAEGISFP